MLFDNIIQSYRYKDNCIITIIFKGNSHQNQDTIKVLCIPNSVKHQNNLTEPGKEDKGNQIFCRLEIIRELVQLSLKNPTFFTAKRVIESIIWRMQPQLLSKNSWTES